MYLDGQTFGQAGQRQDGSPRTALSFRTVGLVVRGIVTG